MAEYIVTDAELTASAEAIRGKTGDTTLIEWTTDKGFADAIATIEAGGVELPELSNPGTASDMLSGKELIDQDGNVVTGTIATKSSSNLTASGATVTVPAGYYATQATKSVATATQATPTVSINSSGLITVSATQTAGYVAAGTKSGTKQLTTQAAKTITPSTSSQTAVASGVYTTGAVTVGAIPSTYVKPTTTKSATTYTPTTSNQTIAAGTYCSGAQTIEGDSNLVAGNIKSGVSIFGVSGSYEGSGSSSGSGDSGGTGVETCTVTVDSIGETIEIVATTIIEAGIEKPYVLYGEGDFQSPYVIENVKCGAAIHVVKVLYINDAYVETNGGAEFVQTKYIDICDCHYFLFLAPNDAGANGMVLVTYTP